MERKQGKRLDRRTVTKEMRDPTVQAVRLTDALEDEAEEMAALCAEFERRHIEEMFAESSAGCDVSDGPLSACGSRW